MDAEWDRSSARGDPIMLGLLADNTAENFYQKTLRSFANPMIDCR
jgi:hypothetical protein